MPASAMNTGSAIDDSVSLCTTAGSSRTLATTCTFGCGPV
jgi:hypothetical protein